jgi:hypothetical protein
MAITVSKCRETAAQRWHRHRVPALAAIAASGDFATHEAPLGVDKHRFRQDRLAVETSCRTTRVIFVLTLQRANAFRERLGI